MAVRDVVTKALEDARTAKVINKSQEAAIALTAPADVAQLLERYGLPMLEELFIVATVRVEEGDQLSAAVSVAEGEKCPRCWNIRALGGNPRHPDVCERCGDALDALEAAE